MTVSDNNNNNKKGGDIINIDNTIIVTTKFIYTGITIDNNHYY